MRSYVLNLIFIVVLLLNLCRSNTFNKNEYGPYSIIWKNFELCEGPKRGHCGHVTLDSDKEAGKLFITMNITNVCTLTQAKIIMSSLKNGVMKKVIGYNVDKPCQHFLVGSLIHIHLNVTDTCRLLKGYYAATIDLNECTKAFLGNNFFYGEYSYKNTFADKQKNVLCLSSTVQFVKLNS